MIEAIQKKAEEICRQPLAIDQPLWSTHILDSLGRMELAFFVADVTGVQLDPEDVCPGNFESLQHISQFLARKGFVNN